MATMFEIFSEHPDRKYAEQAADAAFAKIDRIEQALSRFIENSDVSRLNHTPAGRPCRVSPDTFFCLQRSLVLHRETFGAFDVTVGRQVEQWRHAPGDAVGQSLAEEVTPESLRHSPQLTLKEPGFFVTRNAESVEIDLGGIGKGYAVDAAAALIEEWEAGPALIQAGCSSWRAVQGPNCAAAWTLTLPDPRDPGQTLMRMRLTTQALGASGVQRGPHIIDPHTKQPAKEILAAWVLAGDATTADALSTAFMVLSRPEAEEFCAEHPEIAVLRLEQHRDAVDTRACPSPVVWRHGPWPTSPSL